MYYLYYYFGNGLKTSTAAREPRAASPAPAGSGAGCSVCSPRAGGFGLPGPFAAPSRPPPAAAGAGKAGGGGHENSTGEGGIGVGPGPTEQFIPGAFAHPAPITPAKTFTRENCLPGVCEGKARGPGWGETGEAMAPYGADGFGGTGRKAGDGPSPGPAANAPSARPEPPR